MCLWLCAFVLLFQFHRRGADSRQNFVYFRKGSCQTGAQRECLLPSGKFRWDHASTCSQAHTEHIQERLSWETVGTRALAPSFGCCQRTKNILPPLFQSHNCSTGHHNPIIWKKIRSFLSLSVISLREKLIQERTAHSFSVVSLSFINRRVVEPATHITSVLYSYTAAT